MNDLPQSKPNPAPEVTIPSTSHSAFDVQRSMFDVPKISFGLSWIKNFFDYLGASREEPPQGASFLTSPLWLGIWWGLLIGLILLFCGQTSKFIYIDF
jgi:hypothetical protein